MVAEDAPEWRVAWRGRGWWIVWRVADERPAYSGPDDATAVDVAAWLASRGVEVRLECVRPEGT